MNNKLRLRHRQNRDHQTICRMMPAQGELTFDGSDLSRLVSHQAAHIGIGLVRESRRCFADLTVTEQLIGV